MKFSIVVPVFNTSRYLRDCIASLQALDYPRDEYEILMVDNNSTDGSADILAGASGIKVLQEGKQGSYAARNKAVREAKGEILAFTDSDCKPASDWLRQIEAAFTDPRCQIALGLRKPAHNSLMMRLLSEYEAKKDEMMLSSDAKDAYYGFTNNMAVRRSAFESDGPFLERERGADTIFVRKVVNREGPEAVVYSKAIRIEHLEMDGVFSYYRKMSTYGRSHQLYRDIIKTRPLNRKERMDAMQACLREGNYPWYKSLLFSALLAGGLVAWSLGRLSIKWSKPRTD